MSLVALVLPSAADNAAKSHCIASSDSQQTPDCAQRVLRALLLDGALVPADLHQLSGQTCAPPPQASLSLDSDNTATLAFSELLLPISGASDVISTAEIGLRIDGVPVTSGTLVQQANGPCETSPCPVSYTVGLGLRAPAAGGESLSVRIPEGTLVGAYGGVLPETTLGATLGDLSPPSMGATLEQLGQRSFQVELSFSEPVVGSGSNGSLQQGELFVTIVNGTGQPTGPATLRESNSTTTRTRTRRALEQGSVQDGVRTAWLTFDVRADVACTGTETVQVWATSTVVDLAGNQLVSPTSTGPLPAIAAAPGGPSAQTDEPALGLGAAGLAGLGAGLLIPLIIGCLVLAYLARRRRRRRLADLQRKCVALERLGGMLDLAQQFPEDREAAGKLHALAEIARLASNHDLGLGEAADQLLNRHGTLPAALSAALDVEWARRHPQLPPPTERQRLDLLKQYTTRAAPRPAPSLPEPLLALARAECERQTGAPPPSDFDAVLLLQETLNTGSRQAEPRIVSSAPASGPNDGGGVRVKPPRLFPPSEHDASSEPPSSQLDALPVGVLLAVSRGVGHEAFMQRARDDEDVREELALLKQLLDDRCGATSGATRDSSSGLGVGCPLPSLLLEAARTVCVARIGRPAASEFEALDVLRLALEEAGVDELTSKMGGSGAARPPRPLIDAALLPPFVLRAAAAMRPAVPSWEDEPEDAPDPFEVQEDLLALGEALRAFGGHRLPALVVSIARAEHERSGRPAASDREAIEMLSRQLDSASTEPIGEGAAGGGGVRVRPPPLHAPSEMRRELPPPPPQLDATRLSQAVLHAAAVVDAGGSDDPQDQLALLRARLDEYAAIALPPDVIAEARAEYERQRGRPAATDREALEMLDHALMSASAPPTCSGADGGGGARVRPPTLASPPAPSTRSFNPGAVPMVVLEAAAVACGRAGPTNPLRPTDDLELQQNLTALLDDLELCADALEGSEEFARAAAVSTAAIERALPPSAWRLAPHQPPNSADVDCARAKRTRARARRTPAFAEVPAYPPLALARSFSPTRCTAPHATSSKRAVAATQPCRTERPLACSKRCWTSVASVCTKGPPRRLTPLRCDRRSRHSATSLLHPATRRPSACGAASSLRWVSPPPLTCSTLRRRLRRRTHRRFKCRRWCCKQLPRSPRRPITRPKRRSLSSCTCSRRGSTSTATRRRRAHRRSRWRRSARPCPTRSDERSRRSFGRAWETRTRRRRTS